MRRVCHMSSAHRGLDIRIFSKECVSLADSAYDTHLVITASDLDVERAAEKRVTLHPLPIPSSRFQRMFLQAWRTWKVAKNLDADIYHFHDPELIPYGIILSMTGKTVIYDVHEDLPKDILDKDWIPLIVRKPVARMAGILEYIGARWFFNVVAATPFISQRFSRITPRYVNISNYPLTDELISDARTSEVRKPQICFVGGVTKIRGLEHLIRALPLVPGVTLALCGRFPDGAFEAAMRALPGWAQVDYRGQVDREGVKQVLAESIAGIVTFLPVANHVDAQPNKMFEYMSAELPVIASDFPLWRQIIDGAGAGLCVDPLSPEAIAHAIKSLLSDSNTIERMGKAGRKAILESYNWPNEAAKLIRFYQGL